MEYLHRPVPMGDVPRTTCILTKEIQERMVTDLTGFLVMVTSFSCVAKMAYSQFKLEYVNMR